LQRIEHLGLRAQTGAKTVGAYFGRAGGHRLRGGRIVTAHLFETRATTPLPAELRIAV
jgi:hypothetical protein